MPNCTKLIKGEFMYYHQHCRQFLIESSSVLQRVHLHNHRVLDWKCDFLEPRRLLWTLQERYEVSKSNGNQGRLRLQLDSNKASSGRDVRYYASWMRTPFVFVESIHGGTRYKSRSNDGRGGGEKELGETTIMHHDGHEIQEVPMAVLKNRSECSRGTKEYVLPYQEDPKEEAACVEVFSGYKTPQEVLKMLDTIPSQEVTPFVSLSVLKKLFELENNFWFRNEGKSWMISAENSTIETFARMAIVSKLVDTILTSDNSNLLLDALDVLRSDRVCDIGKNVESSSNNNPFATDSSMTNYSNKVLHEILLRVTEGKFSIAQVSRAVVSLGKFELERSQRIPNDLLDKMWIGLVEKSSEIDVYNIVGIYRTIQYFRKSRRLILNLAEKKTLSLWWKLEPHVVAEICSILVSSGKHFIFKGKDNHVVKASGKDSSIIVSNRLLLALSRCVSLNIHLIKEEDLLQVVRAFDILNFCDESIEKALVKYMKAKCLHISESQLISAILDYTKKFNIRSVTILDVASKHFVQNGAGSTSPPHITSMVSAFGHLDFNPVNERRFWRSLEKLVDEKFIQFPPKDIVDILLSCVYLQKYPINFVDRIFSPYFLDRVHASTKDLQLIQLIRTNMKILDTSLSIECPGNYRGPLLPRNFCERNPNDGRIIRMSNYIEKVLETLLPKNTCILKSVPLPELPLHSLYTADFVLFKLEDSEISFSNEGKRDILLDLLSTKSSQFNNSKLTAIFIHVPEHYLICSESAPHWKLVGSQQMRLRQFRRLGFNTVTLNHEKITQIKVQPQLVEDYLRQSLTKVQFLAA